MAMRRAVFGGVGRVAGMQIGEPSRTAMAVARARAQHQVADEPRVFTDPLAVRIVGESGSAVNDFDQGADPDLLRRRRLFVAGRSRFADDAVAAAIARGTEQIVVLGAGLDTTALRNSHARVRFFEVDHPDTQEWKRHRLAETGIAIPASLTFVPVDFERSTLAAGLAAAGFDRTRGALFVWLGVVIYLTGTAVEDTLRYIAEQGEGAEVVFDYLYPISSRPEDATAAQQRERVDQVAAVGEPWLSFYTAEQLRALLLSLGYQRVEDLSASELLGAYGIGKNSAWRDSGPHLIHAATR